MLTIEGIDHFEYQIRVFGILCG